MLVATLVCGSYAATAAAGFLTGLLVLTVQTFVLVVLPTLLCAPGEYARTVRAWWARRRARPSPTDRQVIDVPTDLGPAGTMSTTQIRQHWGEDHEPVDDDLEPVE